MKYLDPYPIFQQFVYLSFQPPKKKKSGKKGKKGKKSGKKAKTPTVIDGISTEEMSKEQVSANHIMLPGMLTGIFQIQIYDF